MILDVDGQELKVGDVCTIVAKTALPHLIGTEARVVDLDVDRMSAEFGASRGHAWNCHVNCFEGSTRLAQSGRDLRKIRPREDLQTVEWTNTAWRPEQVTA